MNEPKCESELDAADSGAVSHTSLNGNSNDMGRMTYSIAVHISVDITSLQSYLYYLYLKIQVKKTHVEIHFANSGYNFLGIFVGIETHFYAY